MNNVTLKVKLLKLFDKCFIQASVFKWISKVHVLSRTSPARKAQNLSQRSVRNYIVLAWHVLHHLGVMIYFITAGFSHFVWYLKQLGCQRHHKFTCDRFADTGTQGYLLLQTSSPQHLELCAFEQFYYIHCFFVSLRHKSIADQSKCNFYPNNHR